MKPKRGTPYSYETHYYCGACGWVKPETCVIKGQGYWCSKCNRRVRTVAKYKNKTKTQIKRRNALYNALPPKERRGRPREF